MSIYFNQQITTFGQPFGCCCSPMPMPMATPSCTIFGGPAYPVAPMPMAPVPMVPVGCCYPMSDSMAAGYCMGSVMANPYAMQVIGDGLKWGYNNIIKPVWNGVVKPVWNGVVKPIFKGLKWVWDHTLGWCFKKLEGAVDASNAKEAEKKAEAEAEAAEEAEEARAEAAEEASEAGE